MSLRTVMRLLLASLLLGLGLLALGLILDGAGGQVSTLGQRPAPTPPAAAAAAARPDADDTDGRRYHYLTIPELARTTWTHVEVDGTVTLVRDEADGDVHIRLEDRQHRFVVVEIIPAISLTRPKVGDCVRAQGIHRYDGRHRWQELNPCEALQIVPCRP